MRQASSSMAIHRRAFLKSTAAITTAIAFPTKLHAEYITASTRKREIPMQIKRNGSRPSVKGPADWFTGTVRIDPLFDANAPARAAGASVTFEPGARTALSLIHI